MASFNTQLPNRRPNFVDDWPLMRNDLAFIIITYLLIVFKIGPSFMEARRPLQIKWFLIVYNVVKVVNSAVLACKFSCYMIDKGLFPRNCLYDDSTVYTIAELYWKYMVTKILDLCDTVFFILRKKQSQVTFLHVYHHVFMVTITWSCLKFDPSDHWAFMAFINCTIHTVMYTYYGLAAMGPHVSKYLKWKKYVTIMQLIQFVLIIMHVMVQTYTTQCPMHAATYWIGLANLILFIVLFTDFYKKRYTSESGRKIAEFACAKQMD